MEFWMKLKISAIWYQAFNVAFMFTHTYTYAHAHRSFSLHSYWHSCFVRLCTHICFFIFLHFVHSFNLCVFFLKASFLDSLYFVLIFFHFNKYFIFERTSVRCEKKTWIKFNTTDFIKLVPPHSHQCVLCKCALVLQPQKK